jgi:hypothetical protein
MAGRPGTRQEGVEDQFVTTDLNTLLTTLYVKLDVTIWADHPDG